MVLGVLGIARRRMRARASVMAAATVVIAALTGCVGNEPSTPTVKSATYSLESRAESDMPDAGANPSAATFSALPNAPMNMSLPNASR